MNNYIEAPIVASKRATAGAQILSDRYLGSPSTSGSSAGRIPGFALSVALTLNMVAMPVSAKVQAESLLRYQHAGGTLIGKTGDEKEVYEKETPVSKSARLQKAFGFKTAQWSAVLNIERKTLYNWKSSPSTRVNIKVSSRLAILEDFLKEIDSEHAGYISTFAFGRHRDEGLSRALCNPSLNLDDLVSQYDRLYVQIDGKYKRNKHKISVG